MSRKRSDQATRDYRMTLIPSLASVLPATAVYVITLNNGVCMGIRDGQPVAWMFGGTAYLAAHVAYSWLIDRAQERDMERERIKAGTVESNVDGIKAVWETVNKEGFQEGRYFMFGAAKFQPDKLQMMCKAVEGGGLTERNIRAVQGCTRKDYQKLRDEYLKLGLAYRVDSRANSAIELTAAGRAVTRKIATSPTEVLTIVSRRDLRLKAHARA